MRRPLVVILVGLGLVGVLVLGAAAFFGLRSYNRYAATVDSQGEQLALSVWINNPQNGSQLPEGSQVLIQANGHGADLINLMELWVDGQFIEAASTPNGLLPGGVEFHWQMEGDGDHSLFVRGYDVAGRQATSSMLQLTAVDPAVMNPEEATMAYVSTGPSYYGGGGGSSDGAASGDEEVMPLSNPNPLSPEALSPPAGADPDGWPELVISSNPNLVDWLKGLLPKAGPPSAPNLTSAVESCKVRLFIGDPGDNEAGFYVYRQGPSMNTFSKVATLNPYPGSVFTWEQLDQYGQISYYVSTYNNQGEAASNIVTVDVDNENCAPQNDNKLTIELIQLPSLGPSAQTYCYYSIGNGSWQRHPQSPDEYFPFTGEDPLPIVEFLAPDEADSFSLECWSWVGGELEMLGRWTWNDIHQYSGGGGQPPDQAPEAGPGDIQIGISNGESDIGIGQALPPDFHLPTEFYIPVPNPWVSTSQQECADYGGMNLLEIAVMCGDVADDIDFVLWHISSTCPAVQQGWSGECFTEEDIIGYRVYDTVHNGGAIPVDVIDEPHRIYFMIEEHSCAARNVAISSLVEYEGEILESNVSQWVHYPGNPDCPFLTGGASRDFRLTWDTIDFSVGNIDDGVDHEDDAEGYGYLKLWTNDGFTQYWTLGEMAHTIAGGSGSIQHNGVFEFEDNDEDNPYSWSGIPLAKNDIGPCAFLLLCRYGTSNNKVTFPMFNTTTAYVTVELWDADPTHPDDKICDTPVFSFGASSVDLAGGNQNGSLAGNHSSAHCVVDFHIQSVP